MIACNIGPKNRLARGLSGIIVNLLVILFASSLPVWLFWAGIVVSYLILFQGIVGFCYMHALFKTKNMQ